jgi:hypothetical protein
MQPPVQGPLYHVGHNGLKISQQTKLHQSCLSAREREEGACKNKLCGEVFRRAKRGESGEKSTKTQQRKNTKVKLTKVHIFVF